jgi:hypothetical protein
MSWMNTLRPLLMLLRLSWCNRLPNYANDDATVISNCEVTIERIQNAVKAMYYFGPFLVGNCIDEWATTQIIYDSRNYAIKHQSLIIHITTRVNT